MHSLTRKSARSDSSAIADTVLAAFGATEGPEIVGLISDLMNDESAEPLLSLVTTREARVIGHVLFTRVEIAGADRNFSASILAPLAVHPDFQGRGIGGGLLREGLKRLGTAGVGLVFVLGYPDYYNRFGFAPAGVQGLEAPYPILPKNADAWMVQELSPGWLGNVRGKVVCADALDDPKYWVE